MGLTVEYRYSLVVEGNNQNLGVGCKPVETDLEGNNRLGVKQVVGKWDPAELDKLGTRVDSVAA